MSVYRRRSTDLICTSIWETHAGVLELSPWVIVRKPRPQLRLLHDIHTLLVASNLFGTTFVENYAWT